MEIQLIHFTPLKIRLLIYSTKICEKYLWTSDILSKIAGQWSSSLLKTQIPQVFFAHVATAN